LLLFLKFLTKAARVHLCRQGGTSPELLCIPPLQCALPAVFIVEPAFDNCENNSYNQQYDNKFHDYTL